MQEYDIVIVGGGPAGLSAAYSAASNGSSVLLIEKDDGIGVNVRTSGVSWIDEMKKFGIDEEYFNPIKRYRFYSPSNEVVIEDNEYRACVLDVRKTWQYLAKLAVDKGANIMVKTRAVKVLRDDNKIVGIIAKHMNKEIKVKSKLVIDASGFSSVIAKELGFNAWKRYGVAEVSIIEGSFNQDQPDNFVPKRLEVQLGLNNKVRWINEDSAPHTVTTDDGYTDPWSGLFDSREHTETPLIMPGETFEFLFTEPGEYHYHCEPHPWMTGTVIVEELKF
jgi:flavin-dependent dehydrogenase